MKELSPLRLTEYSHGAGCACKLSPIELGLVLGALPAIADPNVMLGGPRDDAAVYRIAPDRALVATVDFFTPIVDDPTEFGAIAAANAVSDVYAMGARPLFALGMTAFPREKLTTGLLEKIVSGGAAKMGEAGIAVVGGHSVDDPEPKFGYAVIGEVHPDRVVGHEGAQAGDVLYLTKPLGSGLVTTAVKRGLCPPALERLAVAVMSHLNRDASAAMVANEATAATDVTGFGLIGHLTNLVGGADIDAGSGASDGRPARPRGPRPVLGRQPAQPRSVPRPGGLGRHQARSTSSSSATRRRAAACWWPSRRRTPRRFESALAARPYPAARIGTINGTRHRFASAGQG